MQTILSLWTWHPSVIVGCIGLVVAYLALTGFCLGWRAILFFTGVLVLLLALESPLDALGDTYLFSAHMFQHQLLILAVPPLLLSGLPARGLPREAGLPREVAEKVLRRVPGALARISAQLVRPPVAWLIGTGAVWLWHVPALYNAALVDERIHLLEHLTFLITAFIFWWPVLAPVQTRRMRPLGTAVYLILAAAACDVLGTLLAYTPLGLYPAYLKPDDVYGILPLLRDTWHITSSADQQAGGLLMGLTADPVYLLVALSAMAKKNGTRINAEERG